MSQNAQGPLLTTITQLSLKQMDRPLETMIVTDQGHISPRERM